jgi:hypothetical protein
MITDRDIAVAVTAALGEHAADHDIDGIVRDIIDRYGRVDVETIDHDEFWSLVEKHAREDPPTGRVGGLAVHHRDRRRPPGRRSAVPGH